MPKNFKHRPLFANTLPKQVKKPKVEWKVLPILWLALKRTAMVLGFFVLINVTLVALLVSRGIENSAPPSLPKDIVLTITVDGGFPEVPPEASFADPFAGEPMTVRAVVDAIDAAAKDERVKGLVAELKNGSMALAHAYEIREALKRFRAMNKFAYIYATSYEGLGEYYLASAFDEIWMQPMGTVAITGINAEIPFFREALDEVGVQPEFFQRKEYKTVYESLTNSQISQQNRETYARLIMDIREELLSVIPEERGISRSEFSKLVDQGLFTAQESDLAGLVTNFGYVDDFIEHVKDYRPGSKIFPPLGDDALIALEDYAALKKKKHTKAKVALVYASGAIVEHVDSGGIPGASGIASADQIVPALIEAKKDNSIGAVVLRIDSPGGSPVASESILHALRSLQGAGKPVIVSMGPTAASGGYWIAAYADKIFVTPTTLTGSIGVAGGKFALKELWGKIGVNWARIGWGDNAGLWSMNTPFSESEAARMNAMLDDVYSAFIQRVSQGRKMDLAAVDKLAGGRVWSGKRAVEIGLADEIGGLTEALDHAAQALGQSSRETLEVQVMPKPKTALEEFLALMEGQAAMSNFIRSNAALFEFLEPAAREAARVQSPENFMTYEPFRLR